MYSNNLKKYFINNYIYLRLNKKLIYNSIQKSRIQLLCLGLNPPHHYSMSLAEKILPRMLTFFLVISCKVYIWFKYNLSYF